MPQQQRVPWVPSASEARTVIARGRLAYITAVRMNAVRVRYLEPRSLLTVEAEDDDEDLTPVAIWDEEWLRPEELRPDLDEDAPRVGERVRVLVHQQKGVQADGTWDGARVDRYEDRLVVRTVRVRGPSVRYPDGSRWFLGEQRGGVIALFCTRSIVEQT